MANTKQARYRPFEEAREYARSPELKSSTVWVKWCKGNDKPKDIPASPYTVYPEWAGWADWLGTRQWGGGWRPFEEARDYARSLGFKSVDEWRAWVQTDARPKDIPAIPSRMYKDEWQGWTDWLDSQRHRYRSFEEARKYVRSLGLRSQGEWFEWARSGDKPSDIPAKPDNTKIYESEWQGYADWLGYEPSAMYLSGTSPSLHGDLLLPCFPAEED
jgi:hypothetical protein